MPSTYNSQKIREWNLSTPNSGLYLDAEFSNLYANTNFLKDKIFGALSISDENNVGIGIQEPKQKLSVAGIIESTTGGFKFPDGTMQLTASIDGGGFWTLSGNNIFSNNTGNVGIGTASPNYLLDIWGIPATRGGMTIRAADGSNKSADITHDGTQLKIRMGGASGNVPINFSMFDKSALYIQGDGNVGVGTTSPVSSPGISGGLSASLVLDISKPGWVASDDVQLRVGDVIINSRHSGSAEISALTARGGNGNLHIGAAGTVNQLWLFVSGNVGIGTVTNEYNPNYKLAVEGQAASKGFVNLSSRELKENIRVLEVEEAVGVFKSLQPVKFNYKTGSDKENIGFIAEDVPALLTSNDRKGLSIMDIVAVLVKVVQEQQKRIEELAGYQTTKC